VSVENIPQDDQDCDSQEVQWHNGEPSGARLSMDGGEVAPYAPRSMGEHSAATRLGAILGRLRGWPGVLWRLEGRLKGVEFEGRCEFLGRPLLSVARGARVVLGDGVRLYSATRANPLGCFQPCVLRALRPGAQLVLGRGAGLSGTVLCAAASIEVGEGTIFGSGAMVIDNDFHVATGEWEWSKEPTFSGAGARPVKIGRGAFIGARAIVLKGVTIGDRAMVGAGAVVTKDVPAHHLATGNPAQSQPYRRAKED
jgi:acetyltransferase-like isoleucine patch superfamily enzyme